MEEYFRLEIRRTSPHDSFVCFLKMIFMYISIGKPWSMWVSMIRTSTLLMEKPNLYIYIYVYVTYPRDWLIPPLIYLWNPCWIYIYIYTCIYIYIVRRRRTPSTSLNGRFSRSQCQVRRVNSHGLIETTITGWWNHHVCSWKLILVGENPCLLLNKKCWLKEKNVLLGFKKNCWVNCHNSLTW